MKAEALTVLCVDDDRDLLSLTADCLERQREDIDVVTETGAEAALERLAATAVDCVVSDYQMPGTDGVEFLERVRAVHPDLPFILFTGKGSEDVAAAAIEAGVTSYLQKETGTEQYQLLANRIRNHVEQYRASHRADRLEERYELVAETATDAFWTADLRTGEIQLSGIDNFGYDAYEADREWWVERVHPDDRDAVLRHEDAIRDREAAAFDDFGENRGWFSNEYRWRRADGTYAECAEHGVALFEDGRAVRMVGTMTDVTARTERERELRRSDRQFEAVFEDPKMLTALLDADGTVRQVNQTAMDFVDVGRDAVLGEPFWRTPWWSDSEVRETEVRRWIERAAAGEYVEYECDLSTADGDPYSVSGTVRPVFDDGDDVVSLIVSARDVTERRRRAAALRSLHDATRAFMDAADREAVADRAVETAQSVLGLPINALWLYDSDDDVLRPEAATDEVASLLGEPPVFTGAGSLSWAAFESGEVAVCGDLENASGLANPDTEIRSEIVLPLGDHGVMNVGSTVPQAFDDVDVSLARILAETVDAALERAEREQTLRTQRRKLERVHERKAFALDVTDTVIWDLDLASEESTEHGPIERVFGIDPVDRAEFFESVVHPDELAELTDVFEAVQRGETDEFRAEFRTVPDHDAAAWILTEGFVRADTDDGSRHLVGLATDVTERKRREREIERQNDRLEEFAGIVSHDLRNPLSTAMGRLELVRDDHESDNLAAIERALERMETIIEDTLTLARQGRAIAAFEAVDLETLVRRCWQTADTDAATLRVDDPPDVEADPDRLRHVFENLFQNAVEHNSTSPGSQAHRDAVEHGSTSPRSHAREDAGRATTSEPAVTDASEDDADATKPDGGDAAAQVTVRVGSLETGEGFYVEDDGPGIPEDERENALEPGYTTARDGSGMGLSIVAEIVNAHGWDLVVTDGRDGGARFEIAGVDVAG